MKIFKCILKPTHLIRFHLIIIFFSTEKIGSLAFRVSEKIEKDTFDAILKASKPVKKKKGKKKKVILNFSFYFIFRY